MYGFWGLCPHILSFFSVADRTLNFPLDFAGAPPPPAGVDLLAAAGIL